MRKDSLFMSIILVFGSLFLILWFINPNYVIAMKEKIIIFLQDIYIITKNFLYNFGR